MYASIIATVATFGKNNGCSAIMRGGLLDTNIIEDVNFEVTVAPFCAVVSSLVQMG